MQITWYNLPMTFLGSFWAQKEMRTGSNLGHKRWTQKDQLLSFSSFSLSVSPHTSLGFVYALLSVGIS